MEINNNTNIPSTPQNFRVTFSNTSSSNGRNFTPNPLLSSTRLLYNGNELCAPNKITGPVTSTPVTNFHISINSTCESGPSRTVQVTKSPVAKPSSNDDSETKKSRKRKSQKENCEEPPSKKSSSDVIVVNDTISDEDSVIFVSETANVQKRNGITGNGSNQNGKAADFISLQNGTETQQRTTPQSSRARKRMEKRITEKIRAAQANANKLRNKLQQPQNHGVKTGKNRFDVKNQNTSFERLPDSPRSPKSPRGPAKIAAKVDHKKLMLDYEKEKKLFEEKPELFEKRMIIIDGSNVARTHGLRNKTYSIKGIQLCMKHFEDQGFKVKAVVPQMRRKRNFSSDPDALERMINDDKIVVTPCKNLPGQRSSSYDDRFILDVATNFDGAVVSNDNFADLLNESEAYRKIITERVIGFSWCEDFIMFPQDPYGKNGRTLQMILHKLKPDAQIEESSTEAK